MSTAATAAPSAALASLIGAQGDMVRSLCIFNQSPADYMDSSRRAEFFALPADGPVWDNERSRRHLSQDILARISVEPCLDTQRPEWPLALLDRDRLDRLARHIAAALVGGRVRRSISRADVLQWREWLTPEAYDFALKRAGLLPFHAEAGADVLNMPPAHLGHAWLLAASRVWPTAIARRFVLKLPAGAMPQADAIDPALAMRLVSSVLSIVEARWCSLFVTMRA